MITSNPNSPTVRAAGRTDARAIRRLLDDNWAVHTRILPIHIHNRLDDYITLVAEDRVALRGLLVVEPQPPHGSLIVAAAIHDNSLIRPVLSRLFPPLEERLKEQHIRSIMQIGEAPWLTRELPYFGFDIKGRIVTFEWHQQPLPSITRHPQLVIRSARLGDLPELLALDHLAFGPMWHKPRATFREALSRAISFAVGVIGDQIVAYEWCDQFGDRAHLTRLATHPDHQGVGIGAQMLHYTLQTLIRYNVRIVSLNTQIDNQRSQILYRRFGFEQTPEEVGVYWKDL